MLCQSCKIEIAPGEQFCGECGTPVSGPSRVAPAVQSSTGICAKCGAIVSPEERFCGECGADVVQLKVAAAMPVAQHSPSPAPSNSVQPNQSGPKPKSALRTIALLGLILSGILYVLAFAGMIVFTSYSWHRTTGSDLITVLMVLSIFIWAICLAIRFPKLYLVYLLPSIIWMLGSVIFFFTEVAFEWGFWPNWMLFTGIANLVGGLFGFLFSLVLKQSNFVPPLTPPKVRGTESSLP